MAYNIKIPATLVVSAPQVEGLSLWRDPECTQPLEQIDFGEIQPDGKTQWFDFYVRNDSNKSFNCLAGVTYPRGPNIFMGAMFTPGLVVGNTNEAFEPGEVGWMSLQTQVLDLKGTVSFEVEIRVDEVILEV